MPPRLSPALAIVGPTAVGKTDLAVELAAGRPMQIVGIDSATAYRGMDIGTAKPDAAMRRRVRHHMFDVADPTEELTVADYQRLARRVIEGIHTEGEVPLLVGGSGLYFRAVIDPLVFPGTDPVVRRRLQERADREGPGAMYGLLQTIDPEAASRIEPRNLRRVIRALEVAELTGEKFSAYRTAWDEWKSVYDLTVAGLRMPVDRIDQRVNDRVDGYVEQGWVQEVAQLRESAWPWSTTARQVLGYSLILDHVEGRLGLDEAVEEIKRRTRKYARRQLRWFRADPRVRWFEDRRELAEYLLSRMPVEPPRASMGMPGVKCGRD